MKKEFFLIALFMIPMVFADNSSFNDSLNDSNFITNQSSNSSDMVSPFDFVDSSSLIILLIGLTAFYIIGKIAFKLTKWLILIVAILLLLKIVLNL